MPTVFTFESPLGGSSLLTRGDDGSADVHLVGSQHGTTLDLELLPATAAGSVPATVSIWPIGATAPYSFTADLAAAGTTAVQQQYGSFNIYVGQTSGAAALIVADQQDGNRIDLVSDTPAGAVPTGFTLTVGDGRDQYQTALRASPPPGPGVNVDAAVTARVSRGDAALSVQFVEGDQGDGVGLYIGDAVDGKVPVGFATGTGVVLGADVPQDGSLTRLQSDGGRYTVSLQAAGGTLTAAITDAASNASVTLTVVGGQSSAAVSVTATRGNSNQRAAQAVLAGRGTGAAAALSQIVVYADAPGKGYVERMTVPGADGTATLTRTPDDGHPTVRTVQLGTGGTGTPIEPTFDGATDVQTWHLSETSSLTVAVYQADAASPAHALLAVRRGAWITTVDAGVDDGFWLNPPSDPTRVTRPISIIQTEIGILQRRLDRGQARMDAILAEAAEYLLQSPPDVAAAEERLQETEELAGKMQATLGQLEQLQAELGETLLNWPSRIRPL